MTISSKERLPELFCVSSVPTMSVQRYTHHNTSCQGPGPVLLRTVSAQILEISPLNSKYHSKQAQWDIRLMACRLYSPCATGNLYDNHDWKTPVKTSYRAAASVIAIAIASLTVPSLAQAKRMGSNKSVRPASIGSKAPAQPAPVAPAAAAPKPQLLRPLPPPPQHLQQHPLPQRLPLVAPA